MYESPITIIETAMQTIVEQREDAIFAKVQDAFDVQVDKQELIRALQYDRWQYEKGYFDGKEEATPKWIPVSERLPDVVDFYLVVVKYKYDYENKYDIYTDVATYNPYEGGYIDNCWNTYNDWDEGQQYIHVTHWMPLPEPPKEEKE